MWGVCFSFPALKISVSEYSSAITEAFYALDSTSFRSSCLQSSYESSRYRSRTTYSHTRTLNNAYLTHRSPPLTSLNPRLPNNPTNLSLHSHLIFNSTPYRLSSPVPVLYSYLSTHAHDMKSEISHAFQDQNLHPWKSKIHTSSIAQLLLTLIFARHGGTSDCPLYLEELS